MVDVGTVGAIVGLCVAAVLGLYLLGACGAAPFLTRTEKKGDEDKDDPKDRRFAGATVPGRPAHIRAADAQKYAETKAAVQKSIGIGAISPKSELQAEESHTAVLSSPVKFVTAATDRPSTQQVDPTSTSTAIPASLLSIQQVENMKQTAASPAEAQTHASTAGHVALDADEIENAAASATSELLRVEITPNLEAGEEGGLSVKLHPAGIEPVREEHAGDTLTLHPPETVSQYEAVSALVAEACAAAVARAANNSNSAVVDSVVCDLSLPTSPTVVAEAAEKVDPGASESVSKAVDVTTAFSNTLNVDPTSEPRVSNPLYTGAGDSVNVDLSAAAK